MSAADPVRRPLLVGGARRVALEALEAARDMRADGMTERGAIAGLERADDRVVLADEALHVAGTAAVGRARDLLMVAEPAIGLGERRVVGERHELDMEAFVEGDEFAKALIGRAVGALGDQPVDRLEILQRLRAATAERELGGAELDHQTGLEEAAPQIHRRGGRAAQSQV